MQKTFLDETGVTAETVFLHESGQMLECGKLHVPASKQDPQGYGSALTYARRYSLMAACGIAPEDDDGTASSHTQTKPVKQPARAVQAANFDAEIAQLKSAGSMGALVAAWGKLDKQTQHALESVKDACKAAIKHADKDAGES